MQAFHAIETELDSFDAAARRRALERCAELARDLPPAVSLNHNMHQHSFFSYNAEGWSPARIAWEARRRGLYAAGLCDFDVLDGLEEFLDAGRRLGLRAAVFLETRAFVREFADREISSPGEPGVAYVMGAGFPRAPGAGDPRSAPLSALRAGAGERNRALVGRINAKLPEIALDYDRDVAPRTPAGAPTERHIISAYIAKARAAFPADGGRAFWSRVLGRDDAATARAMADTPAFEEAVRSRLVKKGGVGYAPASPESFPPAEQFLRWTAACGAIPMATWLDGTSAGEADPRALLDCMAAQGAQALNIIPDRNWNIADPAARAAKIAHLERIVREAERRGFPINIGTEMNRIGQPPFDDLGVEALRPHAAAFVRGARIMVGHTLLARYADFPYSGAAAQSELPQVSERNTLFEAVGALPPLTADGEKALLDAGPAKALDLLRAQAARD